MDEDDNFVGLQADFLAVQSTASEVAQIYREIDAFIDIPAGEYHADKEIVGHSALVKIMRSPEHFKHYLTAPFTVTPTLKLALLCTAPIWNPSDLRITTLSPPSLIGVQKKERPKLKSTKRPTKAKRP